MNRLVVNYALLTQYSYETAATPTVATTSTHVVAVAVALPADSNYSVPLSKSSVAPIERVMNIVIPNGARSGSYISATSPEGTQVQVSILYFSC